MLYLRFCARVLDALFFGAGRAALAAGFRGAARRTAGFAVFFAAPLLLAGVGAAARARTRTSPLGPVRAGVAGPTAAGRGVAGRGVAGRGAAGRGAATAGRNFTSGTAVRWTSVNRGWSPITVYAQISATGICISSQRRRATSIIDAGT